MARRQYSDEEKAVVYGLRESGTDRYFYVGCTKHDPEYRKQAHIAQVLSGWHSNRHFANKVKKIGPGNVVCDILEVTELGGQWGAEKRWIDQLKREGHRLVNRIHNDIGYDVLGMASPTTKAKYEWAKRFISSPPPKIKGPAPINSQLQSLLNQYHKTIAELTSFLEESGYEFAEE